MYLIIVVKDYNNVCFISEKCVTVSTLLAEVKEKELFNGSKSSLLRILHNLDFTWKIENNKRYLMEREDIAQARFTFLRKYVANKKGTLIENVAEPLQVIFMDETWIFQKGSPTRSWQDESSSSVRRPQGDGGRRYLLIMAD